MLVSKNSIKIILLLIFVLVIYQISKSSPNNYIAYLLVATGFYLVYTEIKISPKTEKMTDQENNDEPSQTEQIPEQENNNEPVKNDSMVKLEDSLTPQTIENNDTPDLVTKANKLLTDRKQELEDLKRSLIQTNVTTDSNNSCDCEKSIIDALAPLQVEITKLRNAQKVSVSETEAKVKTYQLLIENLKEKNVLSREDVQSIESKLTSGVLTIDEAISRLEKMKIAAINIKTPHKVNSNKNWWSEMNKSELPAAMYLPLGSQIDQDFSNEYTILNTEKWAVPMPRPPVCINSAPKEIMPVGTTGYPLNVKYFDDARYVSTSAPQEQTKKELEQKLNETND